jgi:glycosyltransferase involved in cell wall biosynthesis
MDKYRISLIVPIYGVEKYIAKFAESALDQTYQDLQFIFVNDGTKDRSMEILRDLIANRYAHLQSRIVIVDKENGGLPSARKAGLDVAEGEYVLFADSDDWMETDAVEKVMAKADETDADIVYFDLIKEYGNKTSYKREREYTGATKDDFIVNMDLIAGLNGEKHQDFKASIDKAIDLSPDNITVHTLCIKKGSYLAEEEHRLSGEEVSGMVDYAHKVLTENGYSPYYLYRQRYMAGNLENVGYAKEGKTCIYNVDIMEEIANNVACGANAISKRVYNGGERIEREASPKDVVTYLGKLDVIKERKNKLFS